MLRPATLKDWAWLTLALVLAYSTAAGVLDLGRQSIDGTWPVLVILPGWVLFFGYLTVISWKHAAWSRPSTG